MLKSLRSQNRTLLAAFVGSVVIHLFIFYLVDHIEWEQAETIEESSLKVFVKLEELRKPEIRPETVKEQQPERAEVNQSEPQQSEPAEVQEQPALERDTQKNTQPETVEDKQLEPDEQKSEPTKFVKKDAAVILSTTQTVIDQNNIQLDRVTDDVFKNETHKTIWKKGHGLTSFVGRPGYEAIKNTFPQAESMRFMPNVDGSFFAVEKHADGSYTCYWGEPKNPLRELEVILPIKKDC
ncbi:MAG: hypothetical protein ACWA5R_08675 [bacterium]